MNAQICILVACFIAAANAGANKDLNDVVADYAKGDMKDLARTFTENGVILPPGAPAVTGHAAIAEEIENRYMKKGQKYITGSRKTVASGESGNLKWSYLEGKFEKNGKITSEKALFVFNKVGGKWLIRAEAYNRDQ